MSSTFSEMQSLIGVEGLLPSRGTIKTRVKVVDVRAAPYGRTHVLVRPIKGEGEAWIDEDTLLSQWHNGKAIRK